MYICVFNNEFSYFLAQRRLLQPDDTEHNEATERGAHQATYERVYGLVTIAASQNSAG